MHWLVDAAAGLIVVVNGVVWLVIAGASGWVALEWSEEGDEGKWHVSVWAMVAAMILAGLYMRAGYVVLAT